MLMEGFATLLSAAAVLLLYGAWRRGSRALAGGGLAGIAIATISWCTAAGPEFGLVYALTVPAVAAVAVIAAANRRRGMPPVYAPALRRVPRPGARSTLHAAGRAGLLLPGTGLATALAALGIGYLASDDPAGRLVLAGLLLPLLWGLGSYWLLAASQPWRPAAVVALGGLAGAGFLALGVAP
jgi:hypothetical protein